MKDKYSFTSATEGKKLFVEMSYFEELRLLDLYIYEQQLSLMVKVKDYENQMGRAIEMNLDKRDWTFNNGTKEWYNAKINLTLKNCVISNSTSNGAVQQQIANPLQKLIEINKPKIMPNP
jgi:hypothetical protein